MASLFKKTFAVVLALAMVFTCLTANAVSDVPSVNGSAAFADKAGTTVTVEVHTNNFGAVYGSDITITIPEGFTYASDVTVKEGNAWVKDSNYVVNGNVIRFLDVRTTKGFDITFSVNVPEETADGEYPVTIEGTFVDAYEADYNVKTTAGKIVIRTNTDTPVEAPSEGYFIPYGSVTSEEGYVTKNEDGTFSNGAVVSAFKLPEASIGVTTFGSSVKNKDEDKNIDPGVQFGSYAVDTADKTYGTLVIMGDFVDFKSVYSSMDEVAIYKKLASIYTNNKPADGGTLKVRYAENKTVTIALVAQTKYMWKGTVNGVAHLQYAVRVTNPKPRTYTSIAYNISNDVYTFSKEASAHTVEAAE